MKKEQGFILPIIIIVVVVAVLGTAGYFVYKQYSAPKSVACTQEAKLCPDGSSVGRTGPNCEFAACPEVKDQTAVSEREDITIKPYEYMENSFDMNNKGFSVKTEQGQLFKIIVTEKTKIFYSVNDGSNANNGRGNILTPSVSFSDFAKSRNLGLKLIGIAAMGEETIKGFLYGDKKTIEATEIYWGVQ